MYFKLKKGSFYGTGTRQSEVDKTPSKCDRARSVYSRLESNQKCKQKQDGLKDTKVFFFVSCSECQLIRLFPVDGQLGDYGSVLLR